MPEQRAPARAAQRTARLDVGHLPDAKRLGAHEPRGVRPAGETDDGQGAEQGGPLEDALNGEEEQQQGKAHQHFHGASDRRVAAGLQRDGKAGHGLGGLTFGLRERGHGAEGQGAVVGR